MRSGNQPSKAVHILHLEQAVNKLNKFHFIKEAVEISPAPRSGHRYNISLKCPLMKQRAQLGEQIQSSRSSILKSQSRKKRPQKESSSSLLEQKIIQLRKEIDQAKKSRKQDYPKPIIYAIQKIGAMRKLKLYAKNSNDLQLVVDSKNVYKTERLDKPEVRFDRLDRFEKPEKQEPRQNSQIINENPSQIKQNSEQQPKHIFLRNIFTSENLEPPQSAPSSPRNLPQPVDGARPPPLRVPRKAQKRSSSQGSVTRLKNGNYWPSQMNEFSGWDIKEEEDYFRLG